MSRSTLTVLVCVFFGVAFTGFAGPNELTVTSEVKQDERFLILLVKSPSVALNRIDDQTPLALYVSLPPSYAVSNKIYPVVYYLPPFDEDAGVFISRYRRLIDTAFEKDPKSEFILVGITGFNTLHGSFYVNSPATGNWEDFVLEVIPTIESRYRVIKDRTARGLFGFSMGGFGAFNLGLKHPDLFQAIFAASPELFDENGLKNAIGTWDQSLQRAYGAAFAPNLKNSKPYADIPAFDGSEADNAIVRKWEAGYGDVKEKVEAYKSLHAEPVMIHIEYGINDSFPWLPQGCEYAAKVLEANGIPYELVSFKGGHSISLAAVRDRIVPFFAKNLRFE